MRVRNKKIVVLTTIIIFISSLLIVGMKIKKEKWKEDKRKYLLEQQMLKQELEPFMEEARNVMRGEKMGSGQMSYYEFHQEGYENVTAIEADANIVVAEINGDKGTLVVEYYINRLDKNGKKISWAGSVGSVWKIEKGENGSWALVDIPNSEGGEELVKEVEKLTEKMRKYGEAVPYDD